MADLASSDTTARDMTPRDMSPEVWERRVDLAAAFRLVAHYGWSDFLATHLSARVPGAEDRFLINPFGLLFEEITASCLVEVDLDGKVLGESEHGINPAGFTIHSAVHASRPEVACAIHTHTPAGVGVATQEDGLLPLSQQALAVLGHTGYHDYEGLAMDLDERARIVRDLGDNNVLILRNHGLLTVGRTVGEAFMWMARAERACRMQLAAQQSGAALRQIPAQVQERAIAQNRHNNSARGYRPIGRKEWPALRRQMDRIDPSYKT